MSALTGSNFYLPGPIPWLLQFLPSSHPQSPSPLQPNLHPLRWGSVPHSTLVHFCNSATLLQSISSPLHGISLEWPSHLSAIDLQPPSWGSPALNGLATLHLLTFGVGPCLPPIALEPCSILSFFGLMIMLISTH